ncbi:MAG: DUF418 domain-containing protein [Candidatus Krumholzibacteriia bacterium]
MTTGGESDIEKFAGQCATCRHAARVTSNRNGVFYRCRLAEREPRFVKYPRLPMRSCPGYNPGAARPPRADASRVDATAARADDVAKPVPASERIASLDVLRGFAVLGILIVNIQSFAMIDAAYFNPSAWGSMEGSNGVVAAMTHILADQKFMTLFAMLFGAGVVLMTARREEKGQPSKRLHQRRMTVLLAFGLLHAYGIWHGDILVPYALCGFIVYPFRKRSPKFLIAAGILAIAVASAVSLLSGWSMQYWSAEQLGEFKAEWHPGGDLLSRELSAMRGGLVEQLRHRAPEAFEFQLFVFLVWGVWRAGGLMLAGMGLFKLGVLSARRSRRFYATLAALGVGVGLPVTGWGWYRNVQAEWDIEYSFFFGSQYNYWASLVVSLGWLGMVMLVCKSSVLRWAKASLAAAGRMALSNYIGQSVICTAIFYGHGLGYFGRVDRLGQLAIVASVWAVQLAVSPLWLRYYRYGPLEWLWRSLTYGRAPAMRRG